MTSFAAFVRKTPIARIQEYFLFRQFPSFPPINWTRPEPKVVKELFKAINNMAEEERQRLIVDTARVAALADERGQTALQSVVIDRATFDPLEGANNRSLWVFIHEEDQFHKAEETRYNDEQRRGRWWSGFEVGSGRTVRNDSHAVKVFTREIRNWFAATNVSIDIFGRHRIILDGNESQLTQIAIYREGRPEDVLRFERPGWLERSIVRPVLEATMTYEANTGALEVIATTRDDRRYLAESMVTCLLGVDFDERQLALREYDLSVLARPFDFPTEAADGIESVTVKELRFMDLSNPQERITLETMFGAERTIWEMARDQIGLDIGDGRAASPPGRRRQWLVTRTRFTIKFLPRSQGGLGGALTLTISTPHSCNLKSMTPQERLIGEKYLRLWGILKGGSEGDADAE